MNQINEYKIVSAESLKELEEMVNKEIRLSWQPLGGVSPCIVQSKDTIILFLQAMTK